MKKRFLLVLLLALASCSKEDLKDTPLEGEWILTDVACFCFFGEDYDFSTSRIRFNTSDNTLTVENNGEFSIFRESGTYAYTGEGNIITIDSTSYVFEITGTSLRLTFIDNPNIADDEVSYNYRKN